MEEIVDYYKLGEAAGKAWRLGHMGEPVWEAGITARQDLHIMEGTLEAKSFYSGFNTGVSAADAEAHQVQRPHGSLSRDVHTFEERIEILESLLSRYQKLGTQMTYEAFEERHRLEQDVTAYFNPPAEDD